MTAEVWPNHARGKGAGLMQCGLGIGYFLASLVWLFVARWDRMRGASCPARYLPAFVALWIRVRIPESGLWEQTDQQRQAALTLSGAVRCSPSTSKVHPLHRGQLVADPAIRRVTIVVFLMSLTTTLAWWGISNWVPPYIASVAAKAGLTAQQWAS